MDRSAVTGAAQPTFAVAERSYDAARRMERHDFLQVVLPVAGVMEMIVGGETGRVTGSRCAVVPPWCDHRFAAQGDNRFLVLDFRDSLATAAGSITDRPFRQLNARGTALLSLLRVEAASSTLAEPMAADALGRYARLALGLDEPMLPERSAPGSAGHEIAHRVRAFLDAAWDQPVTLPEVAAAACCSPAHATRCFRAEFAIGPVAYLQRLRIDRARDLLRTTDLTAGEIAARVGFVSQPWFTRLFAREVGMTPTSFRRTILRESGKHPS